jgi:hypothetical protein
MTSVSAQNPAHIQAVHIEALTPSRTRAGIGGVGTGTGIIAIAQAIGSHTILGQALTYCAPAITLVGWTALYFLEVQASRYQWQRAVNSARKTLERHLDNPRTSAAHKKEIQRMLEQLEKTEASRKLDRVKLTHVLPPPRL